MRGKVLLHRWIKESSWRHILAASNMSYIQINERDLIEIPDNVKEGLVIQSVETIDEVLAVTLVETIRPLPPQAVTHKTSSDTVRS